MAFQKKAASGDIFGLKKESYSNLPLTIKAVQCVIAHELQVGTTTFTGGYSGSDRSSWSSSGSTVQHGQLGRVQLGRVSIG